MKRGTIIKVIISCLVCVFVAAGVLVCTELVANRSIPNRIGPVITEKPSSEEIADLVNRNERLKTEIAEKKAQILQVNKEIKQAEEALSKLNAEISKN
jgi:peptidoglycan hydrolase CwlO-like protein